MRSARGGAGRRAAPRARPRRPRRARGADVLTTLPATGRRKCSVTSEPVGRVAQEMGFSIPQAPSEKPHEAAIVRRASFVPRVAAGSGQGRHARSRRSTVSWLWTLL